MNNPHLPNFAALALLLLVSRADGDLRAYYPFDSDFLDSSGSGNHLTSGAGTPAISGTNGEFVFGGGALDLNKANNEFLVPTSNFTFGIGDPWSVSFWARRRPGAGSATGMVVGDNTTTDSFIWLSDNSSQVQGLRFRPVGVGTGYNGDYATGHDTNFHHWVVVADGSGTIRVYRDNVDLGTKSPSGGTDFDIKAVGSGYTGTNQIFDGQLDELYIFDEAIDATKVNQLYSGVADTTVPTLEASAIVDDQGGGPITAGSLVSYTVTFSEDMDATTVTAADFGNAGTSTVEFGSVVESSPGVFSVEVTPASTGSLRLQVNQGAVLADLAGNELDTTTAIIADTTITVEPPDTEPPTLSGDHFSDNKGGGPVTVGTVVIFTVTFSEDMDENTIDETDFGNTGSAAFTIGSVTEVTPGVFEVAVTPTSVGMLQLEVLASASLTDAAGNLLDTNTAISSDIVLTVEAPLGPSDIRRIQVVLLGGQSNADGRAAPAGLPTSPVNLQQPQDDVDFYENGSLTTLRPFTEFGPEITLGRRLSDNLAIDLKTRVAIIKNAAGGTDLSSDWVAGGDGTTTDDGPRYVTFQGTVNGGLAALAAAYPNAAIEIVGMLWVQGERDARTAQAANYEANLTNFLADIRLTYGSDLWFVVSRLSSSQTAINSGGLATVRAAQSAVAAADPLTALLDTDGFGMKSDDLHFDATGQQQLGNGSALLLQAFHPFLTPPTIAGQAGGDFEITLDHAFEGFDYTLRSSATLQAGDWEFEESKGATVAGQALTFTVTPPTGEDQRFYRIERSLAP